MGWSASPKISRVEKVPRRKEFIVELSDGTTIRALDEHRSRYALEEGNPISQDALLEISASYEYTEARQSAMRLLKTRPRTETEIRRRFLKQGISGKISQRVIDDLKSEGQLNDRLFAALWIKEKVGRGTSGRRRIMEDLRSKGIDKAVVEEQLALNYDDGEEKKIASRLAEKRLSRLETMPNRLGIQRVYMYLLRRGFDADLARTAVEAALRNLKMEGKR
jgi:regulatory protein